MVRVPLEEALLKDFERFEQDLFLTTSLMLESSALLGFKTPLPRKVSKTVSKIGEWIAKLETELDRFNTEVWLRWLYTAQADSDGALRAVIDDIEMLVASSAGRVMITFRKGTRPDSPFISIIGAEELTLLSKHQVHGLCGLQGIGMHVEEAVQVLSQVSQKSLELREKLSKKKHAFFS